MAKRFKKRREALPILHLDAAGIDVGASELFVAVSADRDPQPVRSFPTFTRDLNALADWLQQCGIRSVGMESTSVYWIPVYQILESRGLEVYLVNAQHVKNVPGRKTDVSDCQWRPHGGHRETYRCPAPTPLSTLSRRSPCMKPQFQTPSLGAPRQLPPWRALLAPQPSARFQPRLKASPLLHANYSQTNPAITLFTFSTCSRSLSHNRNSIEFA
jgi:hypothetical protein